MDCITPLLYTRHSAADNVVEEDLMILGREIFKIHVAFFHGKGMCRSCQQLGQLGPQGRKLLKSFLFEEGGAVNEIFFLSFFLARKKKRFQISHLQ